MYVRDFISESSTLLYCKIERFGKSDKAEEKRLINLEKSEIFIV